MIPVKISDISFSNSNLGFLIFLESIENPQLKRSIVLKKETRVLPIFIGIQEWQSIIVQMNKLKTERPLMSDIVYRILNLLDCRVFQVVIYDFHNNTFYAKIFLKTKSKKFHVDARPSDAIAIALEFQVPIFVKKEVMDKGSISFKMKDFSHQKTEINILQDKLKEAISKENYEEAARIRDQIRNLNNNSKSSF